MLKKVIFLLLLICILISPASAWDMTFESHADDLAFSSLSGSYAVASDYGTTLCRVSTSTNTNHVDIAVPYTGYIAYSVSCGNGAYSGLKLYDTNGVQYFSKTDVSSGSSGSFSRIEWIENKGKTGIDCYVNGGLQGSYSYSGGNHNNPGRIELFYYGGSFSNPTYLDAITSSSSHGVIDMDDVCYVTDSGQSFRLAAPWVSGKTYFIRVYSPHSQKVYEKSFLTSESLNADNSYTIIPIANLTEVGKYTIHLYRKDSETSSAFVTMKYFNLVDPSGTGEGSITLDKVDYETGDDIEVWTHLNSYKAGYSVTCDFEASGTNFKKEYDIVSETQKGTISIPDITNVIGAHTVYLINPDGDVASSADFNVYVPGLPDLGFDKDKYERTDKALIYYKNVKPGSSISVALRYGGSTATTLNYVVSGNGVITLDLSSLAAADSIAAYLKESDGYKVDQDNARVIVGNFNVSGRVYNAKTGEAISSATVTIQGNSVNTDINGNYILGALAGFANYSVAKSGYEPITGTVAVFNMNTIHNFFITEIIENGGTGVHGTVVSSKTDYPLSGAAITVLNNDDGKRYSTIANNIGYYEINNNDLEGNLTVTASNTNYDTLKVNTLVNAGSLNNINFRLNAVTGFQEIDISNTDSGSDSSNPSETAEERAYREKFGEMGKHPLDFNGDGTVENSEWKYALERLVMFLFIIFLMGILLIITKRR